MRGVKSCLYHVENYGFNWERRWSLEGISISLAPSGIWNWMAGLNHSVVINEAHCSGYTAFKNWKEKFKSRCRAEGRNHFFIYLFNTEGRTNSSLPFDTRRDLLSAAVKLRNYEMNFWVIVLRSILWLFKCMCSNAGLKMGWSVRDGILLLLYALLYRRLQKIEISVFSPTHEC